MQIIRFNNILVGLYILSTLASCKKDQEFAIKIIMTFK